MRALFIIFFFALNASISNAQYSFHESIGLFPTAFNLKKGESRYTNTDLVLNGFAHGISDKLSLNTGIAIYSLEDIDLQGMARLKYTFRVSENVRLGIAPQINYSHFSYSDSYERIFNPQLTGILTIGKPDKFLNFSYSTGIDFTKETDRFQPDENEIEKGYNYLSIGGNIKISKSFALFTEHVFEFEGSYLGYFYNAHSLMARFLFKKRHQIKFGAVQFAEYYTDRGGDKRYDLAFFPIPLIAYSFHWGL